MVTTKTLGNTVAAMSLILLAVAVVSGLYMTGNLNFFAMQVVGDNAVLDYPNPMTNRLYEEVWGTVNCRATGSEMSATQLTLASESLDDTTKTKLGISGTGSIGHTRYTCNGLAGCRIKDLYSTACENIISPWLGSPYNSCSSTAYNSKVFVGGQEKLTLANGETADIYLWCTDCGSLPIFGAVRVAPKTYVATAVASEIKLYVESYGYAQNSGWLEGSTGCVLTSADGNKLQDMQTTDKPLAESELIGLGKTKTVIVGWRESPFFGNVNPLGKYQNQDVVCKPYTGIYAIDKIGTSGGYTYWKMGSAITTYASKATMCCSSNDCSSTTFCENYECKLKPTVCTYGQCTTSVSQCPNGGVSACTEKSDGTFAMVGWSCDSSKCCQKSEVSQKCCQATCDRVSTSSQKYTCNPSVGCVKINVPQQCGPGYCCNVPGENQLWADASNSPYITQSCVLQDKKCCYTTPTDLFRGQCLDSCSPPVCKKEGESCIVSVDCCSSMLCDAGICSTCSTVGKTCSEDTDCCSGFSCENKTCQLPGPSWELIILAIALIGAGTSVVYKVYNVRKRHLRR